MNRKWFMVLVGAFAPVLLFWAPRAVLAQGAGGLPTISGVVVRGNQSVDESRILSAAR